MFRPVLDLAHSPGAASQGFPEPGLRSGPCDTLPRVFQCGLGMEVIPVTIWVPLDPLLWALKAELCLESFPGMACLMASGLFVFPFWGGHLKTLSSGFLGAAKPNG